MMIKLRDARFSDHTDIAQLHANNWQQHYRGIFSDQYLDMDVHNDLLDTWSRRLLSPIPNQIVRIAVQNETIAGFSCMFLDDDPTFGALLDNLHVASHLHKSGIGKLLLRECAKNISEQTQKKSMYLWVFEKNTNARNVYSHLGGTHVETVFKENPDGTMANVCRYIWQDLTVLI